MRGRQGILVLAAAGLQACSLLAPQGAAGPVTGAQVAQPPVVQAGAHLARAQALQAQRQLAQAGAEFRAALQEDPQSREAAAGLASVLGQTGNLAQAQVLLQDLVTRYPQDAGLTNNLGYVLYLQGHYAQAVSVLNQAGALDPANQRTRNNLKLAEAALLRVVHQAASPEAVDAAPAAPAVPELVAPTGALNAPAGISAAASVPVPESVPVLPLGQSASQVGLAEPVAPVEGRLARWSEASMRTVQALLAPARRNALVLPLAPIRHPAPARTAAAKGAATLHLSFGLGVAGAYVAHPAPLAAQNRPREAGSLRLQMATAFPSALQLNWLVGRSDARLNGMPAPRVRANGTHPPG